MVKQPILYILFIVTFGLLAADASGTTLVVDDFDSGLPFNNVGGSTSVWSCNPEDAEQLCKAELVDYTKVLESGFSLKLTYDISTTQDYIEGFPQTAFNGYRSQLKDLDVTGYKYLAFYVKGDKEAGYTTTFNIELKDSTSSARFMIENITEEWQKIRIPLKEFSAIEDWSKLVEFNIIFDETVTSKEGVIFLDNITFEQ